MSGHQLERRFSGLGDEHLVPLGFEIESETRGDVEFVFNDEQSRHGSEPARYQGAAALADGGAAGSSSVKVAPWPGPRLSAKARPPCRFAVAHTMNRPSPVPFTRCASAPGARWKRRKIRLIS